ncbi:MAG: hypothetical protein ACXV5H_03450 [Halobacteriota archaeon]
MILYQAQDTRDRRGSSQANSNDKVVPADKLGAADTLGEPRYVPHFLLEHSYVAHLARKRFNRFTSKWSDVDLFGIVGLLFFALTLAFGWAIVSKLSRVLSTLEASVASPIVGILFATWAALLIYLLTANLDLAIIVTSALMLALLIFLQPWKTTLCVDKKHLPGIALSAAAASIFMYYGMLTYNNGEYHIAFPLFGDAAFHSSLVTSFAQGANYPPQYPMMAGTLLRYTFLIDFYSGILDRLGLGLQWSIVLPGVLLLASLLALLYLLGCRFTGRRAGGFTVMTLIMFSGGIEFIRAFTDWQTRGISLREFLATQNLNYTNMYDFNYVFTNFTVVVMAQRAALIGFAVGALIILILYSLYVDKSAEETHFRKALAFSGLIAGLLPLFHTYSYACVMLSTTLLFVIYREKRCLYFLVPAILLAIPQAIYIYSQIGSSYFRVEIGWMAPSLLDIPSFWIVNMGLELALLIAGLIIAGKKKAMFYLPYLAIFIIANIFVFQPWNYDNHKFFSFWLMPSALFMAAALVYVYDLRTVGKPLYTILVILATMTGLLAATFLVAHPYTEFSKDEIYVADWINEHTNKDAIFLTGDSATHPAIALAGRLSYLGYYPWMYTHGINTADRVANVRAIYNATNLTTMQEKLHELNISYVSLGPDETQSNTYTINYKLFDDWKPVFEYKNVYGQSYKIYKVE